jgi:hypothetical protein
LRAKQYFYPETKGDPTSNFVIFKTKKNLDFSLKKSLSPKGDGFPGYKEGPRE